jgi:hypothetical protein
MEVKTASRTVAERLDLLARKNSSPTSVGPRWRKGSAGAGAVVPVVSRKQTNANCKLHAAN